MKHRKDYREHLSRIQIHTKTGREKFIQEVGDAYAALYPKRFEFFKQELAKLRQVTTDGYKAGKAGEMYCRIRVPTELWLFLKRWVPDFGDDSKDIELLTRIWSDLVRVRRKDPRVRTTLFVSQEHRRNVKQSGPPHEEERRPSFSEGVAKALEGYREARTQCPCGHPLSNPLYDCTCTTGHTGQCNYWHVTSCTGPSIDSIIRAARNQWGCYSLGSI